MRAAVLVEQNRLLDLMDVEPPPLGPGHVRVRVHATGICGKQLEEISGRRGRDPYLPHLLGHEGSGEVLAIGPGVRQVTPGDHVVLHWRKGLGIDAEPPTFSTKNGKVNAGQITTFSEETVVAENRVTRIPQDIPHDIAALMGCAVTTGMGIVDNDLGLRPGQSIAILGVGGLGLSVVQAAALVSAHPIVAVDIHDSKLALARKLGATHTCNSTGKDLRQELRGLAEGSGFDAVVDVTGNAILREAAYGLTSNTGTTVFAGVPQDGETITIDSFPLHFGRRLTGSHGGNAKPHVDIPRCIRLQRRGLLKLETLITHRFPLEQINEAIAIARQGSAGRCIIEPQK